MKSAENEQAFLVVFDRNLGHGTNSSNGASAPMPNGDVVAAQMRQHGYEGCLILQTGDSSEQLQMYEHHYKGYYIDMILDKHHLPSYTHIYESFSSWVHERFYFGHFMMHQNVNKEEQKMQHDLLRSASRELRQVNSLLETLSCVTEGETDKDKDKDKDKGKDKDEVKDEDEDEDEDENKDRDEDEVQDEDEDEAASASAATSDVDDNVSDKILCKVQRLRTTLQLIGAPKLSRLAGQICDAAKRAPLQRQIATTHQIIRDDSVLEVVEPTLVQVFTREMFVMQKLISAACTTLNEKKDDLELPRENCCSSGNDARQQLDRREMAA